MTLRFSPAAQADLEDIAEFIAQDNPTRALIFVDELAAKCHTLDAAPGIGTMRPGLGEGVRMLTHGRDLIVHRQAGLDLRIERILHGARDIDESDLPAEEPPGE